MAAVAGPDGFRFTINAAETNIRAPIKDENKTGIAMRLIHRYILAAAVTAIACSGASAQVRDDRYSGVTGVDPAGCRSLRRAGVASRVRPAIRV